MCEEQLLECRETLKIVYDVCNIASVNYSTTSAVVSEPATMMITAITTTTATTGLPSHTNGLQYRISTNVSEI